MEIMLSLTPSSLAGRYNPNLLIYSIFTVYLLIYHILYSVLYSVLYTSKEQYVMECCLGEMWSCGAGEREG